MGNKYNILTTTLLGVIVVAVLCLLLVTAIKYFFLALLFIMTNPIKGIIAIVAVYVFLYLFYRWRDGKW